MVVKKENNDSYKKYLEQKHASFGTKTEVINDIFANALGTEVQEINRIVAGEVNEVYLVQTKDGNFILRISREKKAKFLAERWALDQTREVGVPAPTMLYVGEIKASNETLKVCVENKLPGEPLGEESTKAKLTEQEIKNIGYEEGELLAKIHSIKTSGFGKLKAGGVGELNNWSEYVLKHFNRGNNDGLIDQAKQIGISKDQIELAIATLKKYEAVYTIATPHLLHGDYGPKHLLIKDGHIVGVLDFENCMGGDPVYDFAWGRYFDHTTPKEGYLAHTSLPDDFELRVNLYGLRLGLDMIWYYVAENHTTGIVHAKKKMIENLKYFEK
jgi:aminoglycoside phosphotransferase (APT) family kinase protein